MTEYRTDVVQIEAIQSIEGDWQLTDFLKLLEEMNIENAAQISPLEAEEMCLLALQDLEPAAAAAVILKYKLGDVLTEGQIQNFSSECQHERLWEQSAELELHRPMFSVASLLTRVDDQKFPTPDALRVTLKVQCDAEVAKAFGDPVDPTIVARLLAAGMSEDAILNRMFAEAISGNDFPEAKHILWSIVAEPAADGVQLVVISSCYWLNAMRESNGFNWSGPLSIH